MRRLGLLATGVLLLAAPAAFADDTSRGEVSAGWRYYHTTINSAVTTTFGGQRVTNDFSKGWYVDVSGNVSPKFAVVGEVGALRERGGTTPPVSTVTTTETWHLTLSTFMGGIRVRAPQHPRIIPFGQVLVGGQRNESDYTRTTTFNIPNFPIPSSTSTSEADASSAALALDGGVTVSIGFVGVRAQAGYVRMFGTTDADAFRVSLGGVYRF
jgi:hypothetical protein